MSVFFENTCHFDDCYRNFLSLTQLITHIENDHLDFRPLTVDQLETEQPKNIHLSYVLKFNDPGEPSLSNNPYMTQTVIKREPEKVTETKTMPDINYNNNYLDCDIKEETEIKSEPNMEDISQILGEHNMYTVDHKNKKPFACGVTGCPKRYKNINGIKYHYKNHHAIIIPTMKRTIVKHKAMARSKAKMETRATKIKTEPDYPEVKMETIDPAEIKMETHAPKVKVEPIDPDVNMEMDHRYGIPLYKTVIPNDVDSRNKKHGSEKRKKNSYKFNPASTSVIPSTQVPLANKSFNYYRIKTIADIENFSRKHSNYFLPGFEKF